MSDFPDVVRDPYEFIVEYYDLEHDGFFDDISLILQFADSGPGPVLELGCGTGRVLQALVENDFDATGLDLSRPMLDAAVRRLAMSENGQRATLVQGDMRNIADSIPDTFGLAAFTLNALMHLPDAEHQRRALGSARAALAPRGMVLIDMMNPHPEQLLHLGSGVILEGSWQIDDNQTVDKWSHRSVHPADQLIVTDIWYDTIGESGGLRRHKTSFDHRYVHASELRLMLEMSGFEDIVLYGSYELDPFEDDSDRLIALARRPLS